MFRGERGDRGIDDSLVTTDNAILVANENGNYEGWHPSKNPGAREKS